MGLDMYLTRETYVKNWDHNPPEKHTTVTVTGGRSAHIDPTKVTGIIEEVGYWRKANAIHNWFVENVQGGVDECQKAYVGKESLEDLLAICKKVLANRVLATRLLPPTSGFFFGGTELDDWYFGALEETVEILEPLVGPDSPDSSHDYDYFYQSSW